MRKTRNIFLSRFELQNLPISTKILISKLLKNKDLPQLFFLWRCSTHYMRTTLYLYSHTQQSAILSSSSFWHHTKIRRFTMVCRSPHLLFSVRCYKKAIEKNSCVFSGASMWKIAKKTEISKASMKLGQTPWTFPPHQQRMRMRNAILFNRYEIFWIPNAFWEKLKI